MRFLLILIVIIFFVLSLRALLAKPANKPKPRSRPGGNESMVPCALCDLHIPKSEAVSSGGRFFCSTDHQAEWYNRQNGGV